MFDSVCRFLVETFSDDFASWLLGEPITLTELSPSELSLEPIRADALILRQSEQLVVHIEFQTEPKPDIPFRMLDYRTRVYRRFPNKRMYQAVVYLQQTGSPLVYQTTFEMENTRHQFQVIRIWEQPLESFLRSPGLLPFAALSQVNDRAQVLRQVAAQVDNLTDRTAQSNITASAAILAALVLDRTLIKRILRRDLMQESAIYQDILSEGEQAKAQRIALNLLREGMTIEAIARVTELSVEQIHQLQIAQTQSDVK